jgi:hypothetical protein
MWAAICRRMWVAMFVGIWLAVVSGDVGGIVSRGVGGCVSLDAGRNVACEISPTRRQGNIEVPGAIAHCRAPHHGERRQ